jgi:hypothetical protein
MNFNLFRFIAFAVLVTTAVGCTEEKVDRETGNDEITPQPNDFLTNDKYSNLVVEFAGDSTTWPSNRAVNNFYFFLTQHLKKEKIIFRFTKVPLTHLATVEVPNLKVFEGEHRRKIFDGDTIFVWIHFVDSESFETAGNNFILGQEYGPHSIAVYAKKLNELTLPDMVSRFTLETYVMEHDFCHLLGLVNNGTPMINPHEDPDHKHHCSNPHCLMFWKADENMVLVDLLGTNDVLPVLDANCIADLEAMSED